MNSICRRCELSCNIEECREKLNNSIVEKDYNMLDDKIIKLSKSLDFLIDMCISCSKNVQAI